jgi:NAD+-dependent secondary alcohol dehydrogenase Adh1
MTCGVCPGCRRGEDLYCERIAFPGVNAEGGFATYLRTTERSLRKIDSSLDPKDVAALADAGLTAYRACRKAASSLPAGTRCVILGIGGLGHIAIQCLRAMCATEIIAADVSEGARKLAEDAGADQVVEAGEPLVDRVLSITDGRGVEAVLDFVGEAGVPAQVPQLLCQGGTYYAVGYGGTVSIPNWEFVIREINVVGNFIGNYTELSQIMALAARGKVKVHTQMYRLAEINQAIADLHSGRLIGRAILVP